MNWGFAILYWTTHVLATPLAVGGLLTAIFLVVVVLTAAVS
jgi:hypothetical protein